jgi:hypothetical protein
LAGVTMPSGWASMGDCALPTAQLSRR